MKPRLKIPGRVLMTADTVGGVWTYAVELCRGLTFHGTEVLLATMGAPLSEDQWATIRMLKRVTVAESHFALEWMDNPWVDVERSGDWLLALANKFRPDIVHLNGYAHGLLPWEVPVVMVGHSCVLSWWEAVKGVEAPPSWDRYRDVVGAGIQKADQVIAPTSWMLQQLERHYGPLGDPRVISNARTIPASPLDAKEPFVLSVGRLWDEAKNARLLAEAASGVPWPVRLAGDASAPNGRTATFANVELLGQRACREVWDLYRRASIFASPARYEPFGLSALEAAASGCALVLGDIPSFREVWRDAALYVPVDDANALAAMINRLIEDPTLLSKYRSEARLRARRYSVDVMTEAYLAVYSDLLQPAALPSELEAAFS